MEYVNISSNDKHQSHLQHSNLHLYFNLHVCLSFRLRQRRPVPPSDFHRINSFNGLTTLSSFAAMEGLEIT